MLPISTCMSYFGHELFFGSQNVLNIYYRSFLDHPIKKVTTKLETLIRVGVLRAF